MIETINSSIYFIDEYDGSESVMIPESVDKMWINIEEDENQDPGDDLVSITRKEYDSLNKKEAWLSALEYAGVDSWAGYEYALEYYNENL